MKKEQFLEKVKEEFGEDLAVKTICEAKGYNKEYKYETWGLIDRYGNLSAVIEVKVVKDSFYILTCNLIDNSSIHIVYCALKLYYESK